MKHIFIVNSNAGKEHYKDFVLFVNSLKDTFDIDINITKSIDDLDTIINKYNNNQEIRIYAVGGDGTVNGVLNAVIQKKIPIGVIPLGTGNDLAHYIYGQRNWNYKKDLHLLLNGQVIKIDSGKVNSKYFINISSVRFDANAANEAAKFKKKPFFPSSLSYYAGVLLSLFKKNPLEFEVYIDDVSYSDKYLFIVIANGKYYGGGITPAPYAKFNDGLFDVCLIKDVSKLRALRLLPVYKKGQHLQLDITTMMKCKKIVICCKTDVALNIDGDIDITKEIKFEILPAAVNLVVPL